MYEYDKSQELNNQSENQEDDAYDSNSYPTVGMDIHTFSDFKYYFMTLGFTILTMLILKLVWKLTKSISKYVSFTIVKTIGDLSNSLKEKISKPSTTSNNKLRINTNTNANLTRVDSFQSNKLDAILFRNGTKVRRSQSSSTSLKSISLSDDKIIMPSTDPTCSTCSTMQGPLRTQTQTESQNIVRTDSEMSRTEKGISNTDNVNNGTSNSNANIDYKKIHAFGFVFTYKKDN